MPPPPPSPLFPYTTLFRSAPLGQHLPHHRVDVEGRAREELVAVVRGDRGNLRHRQRQLRRRYEPDVARSEEHTSELQSRGHIVCRLLLEKKKTIRKQQLSI